MALIEKSERASALDAPDRTPLRYQPALDGVRGVAVAIVLVFHAGFSWMPVGYLGVSVFFTLSGFLITTLLLTESQRTGSVAIGSFFTRRLKRLLWLTRRAMRTCGDLIGSARRYSPVVS